LSKVAANRILTVFSLILALEKAAWGPKKQYKEVNLRILIKCLTWPVFLLISPSQFGIKYIAG